MKSKELLLEEVRNVKREFYEKYKLDDLIKTIEQNFFNLEYYVLINNYDEILQKK